MIEWSYKHYIHVGVIGGRVMFEISNMKTGEYELAVWQGPIPVQQTRELFISSEAAKSKAEELFKEWLLKAKLQPIPCQNTFHGLRFCGLYKAKDCPLHGEVNECPPR